MRNLLRNPFRRQPAAIALHVGLASSGIALLKSAGGKAMPVSVAADCSFASEQAATPELLVQQLRRLLAETNCTGHATSIVIDDSLARLYMVTPPSNTASLQDCKAAAAMRFQELYGEPPGQWQIDADWHARMPFLACALPAALVAQLRQAASEQRLALLSIVPQFIAAWNRWHARLDGTSWFGIAHGEQLTLAAIEKARLYAVRALQVPAGTWQDAQWLMPQLQREALRLNLAAPERLQICGAAGSSLPAFCARLDTEPAAGSTTSLQAALARTGVHA